ncbi:Polyisoprenoid-binding protein YceI [Ekhidna lutea]|uniref:Polyisoprenoid-binding protein YceI n=1 Tax=Ekhidna lutea TaxID=447679 RepID=A0A239HA44_EKHLU|nr:YceI family protein [Ekhidna lutea]SNS78015.1 Polyisoprenoid-binding protein YceI [Ekhidna lutea]
MKNLLSIATSLLIAQLTFGQVNSIDPTEIFPIERSHSYVGFQIKYMGYAMVRGRFEDFSGTVRYNPGDIEKTSVTMSVDVGSIDTDGEWRDKDLKSDNWFDAEKYPKMYFESTSVEKTNEGFNITGDLTIKETTKQVVINMNPPSGIMKDVRGDSQVIFTGSLTIDRTDYGVKGERWSVVKEGITGVDDMVNIELSILCKRINEDNFRRWVSNVDRPQGKLYSIIQDKGLKAGLKAFDEMLADTASNVNVNALNLAAYMLLKEGKVEEASKAFKRNLEAFPDDANSYDSYAESLLYMGNYEMALKNYQKAYALDPDNMNAKAIIRVLEK